MASFRIGGIVSGLDTDTIISQLVAAANIPRTVMVQQRTELGTVKSAYEELSSRVTDLQTALEAMDTPQEFRSLSGSSNSDAIDVTVDGDGVAGTYNVQVNTLASSAMLVSADTFAATTTTVGAVGGSFAVTYGSTTTTLTGIDSSTGLDDLVSLINDQVDGVTAYLMNTGSVYKLVISGNDTGADNGVSTSTNLASFATPFTNATTATDAEVLVNGVTITNATNTLDDVIQGVTFDLNETTSSAARITVSADNSGMISKVQNFVSAYNSVFSYVGSQSIYDQDNNSRGPLLGESTSVRLTQNIHSVIADQYTASTVVTALSQIGFSTARTGYLELDTTKLSTALTSHLEDVTALFTDSNKGVLAALQDVMDRYVNVDGSLLTNSKPSITTKISGLTDQISTTTDNISNFDDRITAYEERLRRQFTNMELALGRLTDARNALSALLPSTSSSSNSSSG